MTSVTKKFADLRFLVVGDLMLDRFVRGVVERVSPEAPVPVVRVTESSEHLGGAANVALNLSSLGAKVDLAGALGDDAAARSIRALLAVEGIGHHLVVSFASRKTTCKTRVTARQQQIVRFDDEVTDPLSAEEERAVVSGLAGADGYDCIIIEDYAKGVVTAAVVDVIRRLRARTGVIVTVDPNPNNSQDWRGFSAVKPNLAEAAKVTGIRVDLEGKRSPLEDMNLLAMLAELAAKWSPDYLLVTLGEAGMVLSEGGGRICHLPAEAREVYDVSGAGDTAIAAFSLALAAGAGGKDAAHIANVASGLVVRKLGTATLTIQELEEAMHKYKPE